VRRAFCVTVVFADMGVWHASYQMRVVRPLKEREMVSAFTSSPFANKHIGLIDLIIVNYKSTDFLTRCLCSVYQALNGLKPNIYVFDNGSDDHVERIEVVFPEATLLKHKCNLGYSQAVNRVLTQTSSPYIVLLNPDTIVTHGFFESVISFMDHNADIGISGPKVLNPNGSVQGSARTFPTFRSAFFGRRSFLTRLFPNSRMVCASILSNKSDGKTPMEVDWVSGACMVLRRKALNDVGKFDEQFFLYWEDADLCKRMADKGWKIVYYPKAIIEHAVGGSSERNLIRSVFEFHKSVYRYFRKYFNSSPPFVQKFVFLVLFFRFVIVLILHLLRRSMLKLGRKSKTMPNLPHFHKN
jgi:GT2 family glycosyltransferase